MTNKKENLKSKYVSARVTSSDAGGPLLPPGTNYVREGNSYYVRAKIEYGRDAVGGDIFRITPNSSKLPNIELWGEDVKKLVEGDSDDKL